MHDQTIAYIRQSLDNVFPTIDQFFDLPPAVRSYTPAPDIWSIDLILEHITLTSHYLLITIDNSTKKCLKRAARGMEIPTNTSDLKRIEVIGDPDAFAWIRPEHMEPTGNVALAEVRQRMRDQYLQCHTQLDQLAQGEGSLHRVRISVQELGKLDVYEWIYFLVQHANRHSIEMERLTELGTSNT